MLAKRVHIELRCSYHALIKLILDVVRFTACNLEAAQSFLDVFQQVLHMCQLAVKIRRSLEFDELSSHFRIVFLQQFDA